MDKSIIKNKFILTVKEKNAIEKEKKKYELARAASIEALKIVQDSHGWVPDDAIYAIAKILQIPSTEVEEVATFYSQIFRQPVGRHIIQYCDSSVCYINGYKKIQETIENKLKIKPGQTTYDKKFTLLPICCLGNCDKSPTLMIDKKTYGNVTPKNIIKILEQY
ncbi:MAG: NADH-quinone oxidoreductase subunit NuoE [Candidatus Dasytiphilus stammeri]